MTEPLYVITGATGHVGSVIANKLLDLKKRVRVIGRDGDRLKTFTNRGAEAAVGSLEDAGFTRKALEGANVVLAMIPSNFTVKGFRAYQNRVSDALVSAIKDNKVDYVVTVSGVGANFPEGTGPTNGLYDLEQKLNKLGMANVLHLRCAGFMENNLLSIGMIKSMNANGAALRPDLAIPMIATQDIGEVAARRLANLDFKGNDFKGNGVLELLGPRDLTMNELTTVLGRAIGKPELKYIQFPYEDFKKGMVDMGASEELAGLYIEMFRGFNEGKIKPTQPRSPQTTTPTTIEAFAESVFAPAFRAS